MPYHPTHKMKIIGGLHKNAELLLEQDVSYLVGSADHCDVILLDSGVRQEHVRLLVSQGRVDLIPDKTEVFVDGRKVHSPRLPLSDYQVVTLGEAHLAVGPAGNSWPPISPPPVIDHQDQTTASRDLVLVDTSRNLPGKISQPGCLHKALKRFSLFFARLNKKTVSLICLFLFVFTLFVCDIWHWALPEPAQASNASQRQSRSVLLALYNRISHARQDTLVSTGLKEPSIDLRTSSAPVREDPADHIRYALRNTWGGNLTETRMEDQSIQFKGYDEQNRTDLLLNLEQDGQGELSARGYTLSPKKKKALLSQMRDIIQVKVEAAEDMENLARRVLEKKGVRNPGARFVIEDNAIALKGESDDAKTITTIADLIAKAFPQIQINNKIKLRYHETARVNILGISTSGAPHVILADGTKVFAGGKVNNTCTVTEINQDHIVMSCNGAKIRKAVN